MGEAMGAIPGSVRAASRLRFPWTKLAQLMISSHCRSSGAYVQRVPSGPLSDALYRDIQEFQRAVETNYFGADAMTCHHGRDYTLLLRSCGDVCAFSVRDRAGRITGLLSLNRLRFRLPGGRVRSLMYVAHLHVLPDCRAGIALPALIARAVFPVLFGGGVICGLARVGGGFNPTRVSRVLNLPTYAPVAIARLITYTADAALPLHGAPVRVATEQEVRDRYAHLTRDRIAAVGGNPAMRSALPPRWLMAEDGSACGCIEDYHATTRWIRADGTEFRQSNISFFGWRDPAAAASFVRGAVREADLIGADRLRIILDERLAQPVVDAIGIEPEREFRWSLCAGGLRKLPEVPWVLHAAEL